MGQIDLLKHASQRASKRKFFVASALAEYQKREGLGEQELSEYLQCSLEDLPKLGLCQRPDPSADNFRGQIAKIAAYVPINADRLAHILLGAGAHRFVEYELGDRVSAMGRSHYPLTCECGHHKNAYVWSWGGRGYLRCPNCKGCWDYDTIGQHLEG